MTSKISKEAKEAVQECVSEFISFITSEAAEKCHDEKRKTIGGEDVLYAMMLLGLEQYVEPLKIHLSKMRTVRISFLFILLFCYFSQGIIPRLRLSPPHCTSIGHLPLADYFDLPLTFQPASAGMNGEQQPELPMEEE